ncbi:type IV pilus assembly protein PilO [Gammaproteobacteria bacterium]
MDLPNFAELDPQEPGNWPPIVQFGAIFLVCAFLSFMVYFLLIQTEMDDLEGFRRDHERLKNDFHNKQQQAANLNIYRKQKEELSILFEEMLGALPPKADVDTLLTDLSKTGLETGLELKLFKPGPPSTEKTDSEFNTLPLDIHVTGSYHEIGKFVSGIASLTRIVTLHNVKVGLIAGQKGKLSMDATAKVYYYQKPETAK